MKKIISFFRKKPVIISVNSISPDISLKAESNWVCGNESC